MKERFNNLISDVVKPLLKEYGYGKKALSFYRNQDDLVFVFNFQNSQGNNSAHTKFYVNCGIHSTAIDKAIGKAELFAPKEYECYFKERISSLVASGKDGYIISQETDLPSLASTLSVDLKAVFLVFDAIHSTNDLVNLMIERNGLNNYMDLFEYLLLIGDEAKINSFVKKLHQDFGTERRWAMLEGSLNGLLRDAKRPDTVLNILGR